LIPHCQLRINGASLKPLAEDCLFSSAAVGRGYFRQGFVTRLWNERQSGAARHQQLIWSLVMLELWHRELVDRFDPLGTDVPVSPNIATPPRATPSAH
jgi:hypothetical protein